MKRLIPIAFCIFLSQISSGQVMMMFSSDSLANITSPADLDSLFYWFAADVGVTDSLGGAIANNEGVGTWADLSGNGYDVTQTTNGARPVWKATGGPGSKPCIQFDGSNDFLASAAHWWGSDDLTVFVVVRFANATRNAVEEIVGRNEGGSATKAQWDLRAANTAGSYYYRFYAQKDGTDANITYDANGAKEATWRSIVVTASVSATTYHKDGVSQSVSRTTAGTGDGTIYNTTNPLSIGALITTGTPVIYGQISLSEIIIYSRALTTAERQAIENYLNKKYDLY